MPSNEHSQSQPTSSREPFTHSVSDVKRQPLGSAPRGEILAPDIALFGDVLIRPQYLRGRERTGVRTRDLDRGPQHRSQCRRTARGRKRKLKFPECPLALLS